MYASCVVLSPYRSIPKKYAATSEDAMKVVPQHQAARRDDSYTLNTITHPLYRAQKLAMMSSPKYGSPPATYGSSTISPFRRRQGESSMPRNYYGVVRSHQANWCGRFPAATSGGAGSIAHTPKKAS